MQTGSRAHSNVFMKNRCKSALSGVVAIASATTSLIPLAAKSATAATPPSAHSGTLLQQNPKLLGQTSLTAGQSRSQTYSQAQAIAPQIGPIGQATFSRGTSVSTSQPPAAVADEANLSLAYATQANTAQTHSAVQTVIAQIAKEATRTQACTDSNCRRLTYIRSQIPAATQKVQRLEKQLNDFSSEHAQGNMSAYQKVLSDRIIEISGQKQQLAIDLGQTRLQAQQLRAQLSFANIEADIAEKILKKDAVYQASWDRLEAVEDKIQAEYSQVSVDGTALNQLYADYQKLLEETQTAAEGALGRYLLEGNRTADAANATFATAEMLKDLLAETHQQRVQQLRQENMATIETKLMDRHQQLSEKIGEYERLQLELYSEQKVLDSYNSERDRLTDSPKADRLAANASANPSAQSGQSLMAAQALVPLLPDNSIAKTLLVVVIAASAVAAATHRGSEKKAASLGKRILEIIPVNSQAAENRTVQPQLLSLSDITSNSAHEVVSDITSNTVKETHAETVKSTGLEAAKPKDFFEASFVLDVLDELDELPDRPRSFCVVNDLGEFEISENAILSLAEVVAEIEQDKAAAEIKTADFQKALESLTPDTTTDNLTVREIGSHDIITPVQLPVAEIDLLVEKAIEWVLKDLGLETAATVAELSEIKIAEPATAEPVSVAQKMASSTAAKSTATKSTAVKSSATRPMAIGPAPNPIAV